MQVCPKIGLKTAAYEHSLINRFIVHRLFQTDHNCPGDDAVADV